MTTEDPVSSSEEGAERKMEVARMSMGDVCERYLAAVSARSDKVNEIAHELLTVLRRKLHRKVRQYSLQPRYVGLGGTEWDSDSLDELTQACAAFVFVERFDPLCDQALVLEEAAQNGEEHIGKKVGEMVEDYIRAFLTLLQRRHDRLGYRLYQIFYAAVRDAVAAKNLFVLDDSKRIRNATVLSVALVLAPKDKSGAEELKPIAARWVGELLPGLVTAVKRARRPVVNALHDRLAALEESSTRVFRFKDMLDAIKHDVRARWNAMEHEEIGDVVKFKDDDGAFAFIRVLNPETSLEDDDYHEKWQGCVSNQIEKGDMREKTRAYLEMLWGFLLHWSADDAKLPSNREIASKLDIPRGRIPGLYETLGLLAQRCQVILKPEGDSGKLR